jgi:hypothetical protein
MSQHTILECEQLRAEAQEVRAKAIGTSIAAALTFCRVAENEARWHSPEKALASLKRVRQFIQVAQHHIEEPHHVARAVAVKLQDALDQLKTRAEEAAEFVAMCSGSRP